MVAPSSLTVTILMNSRAVARGGMPDNLSYETLVSESMHSGLISHLPLV